MKIRLDLNRTVVFTDGKPATFNEQPLTFRQLLLKAVLAVFEQDQTNALESRMLLMSWGELLNNTEQTHIDLTFSEAVILTNRVVAAYVQPIVVFRFIQAVEEAIEKEANKDRHTLSSLAED